MLGSKEKRAKYRERVALCERLIGMGAMDAELFTVLAEKHKVMKSQAAICIKAARKNLLERLGRDRDELRAEAMAYYQGLLRDKSATRREKLMVRGRMDDLLGLYVKRAEAKEEAAPELETLASVRMRVGKLGDDAQVAEALEVLGRRGAE